MLPFIRYWLPGLMLVAGFVILFVAGEANRLEGWAMLVGAAMALFLLNVLYRIGASGDRERQEEEDARDYLMKHGHWPDEEPK